jgi:hypothetical protein
MDNSTRGYPAIIPPEVRYDKDIQPNAKLLYGELTVLCHKKGYCWASNTYFAELYGVSKFTISRWISSLVNKGHIRIEMSPRDDTSKEVFRKVYLTSPLLTKSAIGIDEKRNTPPQKEQGVLTKTSIPYCGKEQGGIDEKRKDNKTRRIKQEEYIESPSKVVPTFKVHTPPEREIPLLPDDLLNYYFRFNPTPKLTEKEKLAIWAEQYTVEKVKDAIDVAIENEAHHIKYIGRVLENNKGGAIKHDNMGGNTSQGESADEWADRLAAEYHL